MGAAQTGPNAELFVPFQPYYRPKQFKRRVATLVGVTCASMFLLFVFIFSVPVSLGLFSVVFARKLNFIISYCRLGMT